jgi:drug/metabolite transporter (DMT)-like permease
MVAVLLALAAGIGFGGSDYAAGLASRKASVLKVTVVAETINAALVLAVVLAVSNGPPTAPVLAWGTVAGVSGVAGLIALFMGFRHAAFSVASPVSAVTAAGLSVLAGMVSGERPDTLSLAGMLLTAPAIVAVSVSAAHLDAAQQEADGTTTGAADVAGQAPAASSMRRNLVGVAWGLAAGAGFALFLICLNRAGSTSNLWPVGVSDSAGLVTAVVIAKVAGELDLPPVGTRQLSLLSGLVAGAATVAIFLASHYGLLAVTAVIYSLYPAGTIILARVLSHERLTKVGLCGLCLGAVSVSLIAAGAVR